MNVPQIDSQMFKKSLAKNSKEPLTIVVHRLLPTIALSSMLHLRMSFVASQKQFKSIAKNRNANDHDQLACKFLHKLIG